MEGDDSIIWKTAPSSQNEFSRSVALSLGCFGLPFSVTLRVGSDFKGRVEDCLGIAFGSLLPLFRATFDSS